MEHKAYAVLIDGGFVRYTLKRKRSDPPIDATVLAAFIESVSGLSALHGASLHRVYFYDARPLTGSVTRPDGVVINFATSKARAISTSQHQAFSRLPYVAMRFGELSDRGWKVPERLLRQQKGAAVMNVPTCKLVPNVQQKGVDMRIGLDIATLALKRQAGIVVLVTGDSDLVPAMKLARREGAQIVLITLGQKLKDTMYDHADVVVEDKSWIAWPTEDEAGQIAS